jgi:hypothetical protein
MAIEIFRGTISPAKYRHSAEGLVMKYGVSAAKRLRSTPANNSFNQVSLAVEEV